MRLGVDHPLPSKGIREVSLTATAVILSLAVISNPVQSHRFRLNLAKPINTDHSDSYIYFCCFNGSWFGTQQQINIIRILSPSSSNKQLYLLRDSSVGSISNLVAPNGCPVPSRVANPAFAAMAQSFISAVTIDRGFKKVPLIVTSQVLSNTRKCKAHGCWGVFDELFVSIFTYIP